MFIQQLYTKCLAEATYYIESNGEAAIVDPLRETKPYLELAASRNATIKYVFETHFHADFVSGHIDLAEAADAKIIYGPTAVAGYDIVVAEDDEIFPLGNIMIKVLHTPGHTLESSCFLVIDENGKEHSVFTGDTLFIGDVGRPDLAVKTDLSREDLARHLYRSINSKLLTLDDDTVVFPGHGAGSQCGKNLSDEKASTIGNQKRYNYALQEDTEDGFVKAVTDGLNSPPQYFPKNATINKRGYESFESVLKRSLNPLDPLDFLDQMFDTDAIVIDTREEEPFSSGHVPGAYFFGLNGSFAVWVGTLITDLNTQILLVTDPGKEEEAITRLARVGYDNVIGYLNGGYHGWESVSIKSNEVENICPVNFRKQEIQENVIDVRTPEEVETGTWEGALNIPLKELQSRLSELDESTKYYIYCRSGYRSMMACSILLKNDFNNLVNVKDGYLGIMDPSAICSCAITK
jgi:hydroxyacylglutathione hydrolase